MIQDRPRVVVVGAGFGGLWTTRSLVGEPVDVTVVDRNNYHTFFPLLYQVAAAELAPTDIAHPVRSVFRRASNVDFRLAEVRGLDLSGKSVLTSDGSVAYDHLVLALGSVPHFFGVPGAEERAFPLRWMDDAIPIRHHILTRFERAGTTPGTEERARLLTFVVVGGGPTGVEFAGALAELIHGPLLRDYRGLEASEIRIVLVELADRLLSGMPEKLGSYARARLESRGVEVMLGRAVEEVDAEAVRLGGGGDLPTETVVWTAGIRGDPRVASWGLPVGPGGRVPVGPDLSVEGRPEVSVVGDLAYLEDDEGRPMPQVAQVAIQQGRWAAGNVLLRSRGEPSRPFAYEDPGMLAVIGRNAAVAHVFGRAFQGFPAWLLWLGIHITWLVGFRNRALVMLNWAWNYFFPRKGVRLVLPTGGVDRRVDERLDRGSGQR
ncbi:MAG: NAD(P)/FAD-dependent oxidoreductase, partial [Gemmatimonadota bacterium]